MFKFKKNILIQNILLHNLEQKILISLALCTQYIYIALDDIVYFCNIIIPKLNSFAYLSILFSSNLDWSSIPKIFVTESVVVSLHIN